jgi:molybdopterin-guanine dinucleotide biosynthesis protein MobB
MAPVDIVLLDGFRRSSYPKIEVVQSGQEHARLAPDDPMILAITSDVQVVADVPCLALSDIDALADFVLANARDPIQMPAI